MARTISTAVSGTVYLAATDTPVTITSTGSVTSTGDAISAGSGASWQIANFGNISGGAAGIYFAGSGWTLQNSGQITGSTSGVYASGGGTVTNNVGGLISGNADYGVYIGGGPGVVTNAGTISSGWLAVDFAFNSALNRLVVAPGAVFNGLVRGGNGTLELAAPSAGTPSAGSIGGVSTTTTGSFQNFQTIAVDAGASWTLTGTNTISNIIDAGSLVVTGALPVATIQIGAAGGGGSLEVASAPGSQSQITFLGSSTFKIDAAASFGSNVGSASYIGPLLENFGAGDTIDILNFSATGATLTYNSTTGLLQITSGANVATLDFQTSSLANGGFQLTSDGGTGIDVRTTSITEALFVDSGSSSTDGVTNNPALTGSAPANTTVTLTEGGATLGTAAVSSTGSWNFAPASLAQGANTIVATDGSASTSLTFICDSVPPAVTEAFVNGALTGSGDPNTLVTLTEGSSVIGAVTADSTGAWTYAPTSLPAGVNTVVASETDVAGNTGSASLTFTYTPPPVTEALVADTGASSTDGITNNPALTGMAAANTTVTLTEGSATLGVAAVNASGIWSFTPTSLAQGSNTIVATDGGASTSLTFTYDSIPPTPIFTQTPPATGATSAASFTFSTSNTETAVVYSYELDSATTWTQVSGANLTLSGLVNGSHTLRLEATDLAGNVTTTPTSYTWTVGAGGRTISTAVTGPVTLAATDNPLTITSSGSVTTTTKSGDGVDGGSGTVWSITNSGGISSSNGFGVYLSSSGGSVFNYGSISGSGAVHLATGSTVTNYAGATIKATGTSGYSAIAGIQVSGSGTVNNAGTISAISTGYGVSFDNAGTITNSGSITGGEDGVLVYAGVGQLNNYGSITANVDDGVGFFTGGAIVNAAGATISAPTNGSGVYITGSAGSVQNSGSISGKYEGVYIEKGGTVTNAGTISGSTYSVYFSSSGSPNRLIVDPGAVFNGAVTGGNGTLELANGAGSIGGLNNSQFTNFQTLAVDAGGTWTLNGAGNTIANVTENGTLDIAAALRVSTAVNPASAGAFALTGAGSQLEVASAQAATLAVDFLASAKLIVDNASLFGTNVGLSSYSGPLLENFGAGDTLDIRNFSLTGASLSFDSQHGILQMTNSSHQMASLDFQTATLGGGAFHLVGDGGSGVLLTRS